jgi:hypothetical protein
MIAPVPNRRAKLEIVAPSASAHEAAAVIAAVERFLRDTAPPPAPPAPQPSAWVRAARLEAIGQAPEPGPWGLSGVPAPPCEPSAPGPSARRRPLAM